MVTKVENNFFDVHTKLREEIDGLRDFINLEMYLPLKKCMTMIDSHSEYL